MSLTLIIWLLLFAGLAIAAFTRPVYAVSLYMLTFFLSPPFWWWGDSIEGYRWNFISGCILLGVAMMAPKPIVRGPTRTIFLVSLAIIVNATLVNFVLAGNNPASADAYSLLLKFFVLIYAMYRTIRSTQDLQIVMLSILFGAAYIGFEIVVNDRGDIVHNRLEGVGAPGATTANHFASLMVTILPMVAPFFLVGKKWMKILVVCLAPFIVNVVLLCNSRGAFLAAITSAIMFIVAAPKDVRAKAIKTIAVGAIGVFLLLGDVRIVDRFLTTFASAEERDDSSQSRLDFWKAGLAMIGDYPLGAGGHGFKKVHGAKYLRASGVSDVARAVHNGYINEACAWGIQGISLRLFWYFLTICVAVKYIRRECHDDSLEHFQQLTQIALLSGFAAYLVTCLFGDQNTSEWGYWMVAMIVSVVRLEQIVEHNSDFEEEPVNEDTLTTDMLEV